ncbi:MAG: hypothetical protein G01um10145_657 [Microgenomates group bacterium Gr01-1014_5]|nr:MAG: hypothetical protein G01um10145_657 [Microgenomates group bacterium Gr01-1014_5]
MQKLFFGIIVLLAIALRLYSITSLPALNADEAAIGYNAYSLLETGKDEHGNPWPIHFQSFNDFKPGLYFYLVLPFVTVFGLTELAVRLPGVLLGVGTVILVWCLAKRLLPQKKGFAELSALFLAISPWHIHFSRGGWEVNAGTFFITLGLFAFLKGGKKWYFVSGLAFVCSLYTYHAARVVVPLLILGLLIIEWKKIKKQIGQLVLPGVISLLVVIPLLLEILGPAGVSRAAGVGLFADTGPFWQINEQRGEHGDINSLLTKVFHNKLVNYGLAFAKNYTEHYWGEFLFLSGDEIQRNKVPDFGQMYMLDLIFLVAGLVTIAKSTGSWRPILLWLLVAPTAAALTFQSPHALRAQNMVVPLILISAYGALGVLGWLGKVFKSKKLRVTCYVLLVTFYVWDFTRYLHQYYTHLAKTYDYSSQYGVKELISYVKENDDKFQQVAITDRYDQPYILTLFYLKYPPRNFQQEHVLTGKDQYGFSTVGSFGKYRFTSLSPWDQKRAEFPNAIVAGAPNEIPDGANVLKTIYFPSGRIAFKVVGN